MTQKRLGGVRYSERPHYIYGLCDPRDGIIRYIGCTADPEYRLGYHFGTPANPYMDKWIKNLRRACVRPAMKILEILPNTDVARRREIHVIAEYGPLLLQKTHVRTFIDLESLEDNAKRKARMWSPRKPRIRLPVVLRDDTHSAMARKIGITRQAMSQRLQRMTKEKAFQMPRRKSSPTDATNRSRSRGN